jgi:short-subunit dehydrogenase
MGRDALCLEDVGRKVESTGAKVTLVQGDLLLEEDRKRAIEYVKTYLPDLLFLNAGMGCYGRFVQTPLVASEAIISLNVGAIMGFSHAWCEAMLFAKKEGKVIFIASAAAFCPFPGNAVYAASKAFMVSFAEALRFELRSTKLDVLTICPGQFTTCFQQRAAGAAPFLVDEAEANRLACKIIKKLGRRGVYMPFPWRWLLALRFIFPKRWLMSILEHTVLSRKQ